MFLEMRVHAIAVDPTTKVPIVILKDLEEKETLPIWIGVLEASAIATELETVSFSRPMTHDLLKQILKSTDADVTKITVTDVKDNVYYAIIHINSNGKFLEVDARPSDAIALALRTDSPIMVDTKVLRKTNDVSLLMDSDKKDTDIAEWLELLEELKPEEFGKYKM